MFYHCLDSGTRIGQVLTRIKVIGMLIEMLADTGSKGKAQVTVDIDLTNG